MEEDRRRSVMFSGKKITREDTWKPEDLIKHIQNGEEDSRRTEKDRRKHREGSGTRDEREKDRAEAEHRKKERYKEKERDNGGLKERDLEREKRNREGGKGDREKGRETRDREKDIERQRDRAKEEGRDREKERWRERRDREKDGVRERRDREKEKEMREREKDGVREKRDREKERERRDREKERERREREKEREKSDREKGGVRERRDMQREREKSDREKDGVRERRDREKERERSDREKGGVRERRDREKERERSDREKDGVRERRDREKEREKREKERHRERDRGEGGDERRREKEERKERRGDGERERGEEQNREWRETHRQDSRQRDKEERREQRRREEEEREQRHRAQEGDEEERDEKKNQDAVEDVPGAAEDYGNEGYEDDFEDYEEDFEECDEDEDKEEEEGEGEEREMSPHSRRELEDVRRAMEKENEMVITVHSTSSVQERETFHRASSRESRAYGRVIDFTAARQRERNQQAAEKHKKRSVELLRLIDLDFSVTECLLDLPPVREYDAYIRSYGTANTKQVYVQCNEDSVERDSQTEDRDVVDKWTQHPPESSVACGGDGHHTPTSHHSVTGTTLDSKRLAGFLRSSTQVMAVLLEENATENNSVKKLQSQTHTHSFSDGCVRLNTSLSLLQGRQVTLLHFSQTQPHTVLSVHSPHSSSNLHTLHTHTLICVWNIWEPSTPQRFLIYETEVRSCCFSPGKAVLVFAGTDVGSVVVWDLREPSSSHSSVRVCEEEWTLRYPTFSTDAVLSGAGHSSPIVSVEAVMTDVGAGLRDPLLANQEESLGLSFQLGSLDEHGLLNLWVVVELSRADDSGSQTDLGLRPGGKVKLLHSSSLQTSAGVTGVTSHLSSVLKFLPSDSNHYFIGSNMGLVRHGTRHGLRAVPKLYMPKDRETAANVTALEFCPNGEPYFLVGCSDGVVRLHACVCEEAVCEWVVCSGCVQCVSFSPTRCCVFCTLDSASVLNIWDLTQRDDSPVLTQDLHTDPVSTMAVFGDAARRNPYSGVALGKRSGSLEIHFLFPSLTLPQSSDALKLHSLSGDTL